MRRMIGSVLASAALVASACSSSASTGGGPATRPPGAAGPGVCGLVTLDELKAATGAEFSTGRQRPDQDTPYGTYSTCLIQEKAHPATTVTIATWSKASAFDKLPSDDKPIGGLGDKAVRGDFGSVYVVAKGRTLFVQYYGGLESIPDATMDAGARTLAEDAIARL